MKLPAILPDKFLRCMSAGDRKKLGPAGVTAAEGQAKAEAKSERELQSQIVNLLRLKGIEVLWHRTDKKSHATVGWPDLTFAVSLDIGHGFFTHYPCAWEVKLPAGQLSNAQERMEKKLQTHPNAWQFRVIHSVDEALRELRAMGIS